MPCRPYPRRTPALWRRAVLGASLWAASGATAAFALGSTGALAGSAATAQVYAIPSGSLQNVLDRFRYQTGIELHYDSSLLAGKVSAGLHGRFTIDDGFVKLLAGTGLQAVPQSGGDYALRVESISSTKRATTLSQVQVTAQTVTNGYVATTSTTGTKTDTPLIEAPQSISVITRDQMTDQAANTIGEALRYTPGVIGEQFGGLDTTVDYFTVRGFPNQFPFIDGLSTQTFFTVLAPTVDAYALERIDVLRGPASVLYGQNIPGGLINLVTKQPTSEPLHEVSLETGNYGMVGGQFDFSGPLTQDGTLLYRLTGDAGDTGTQTRYVRERHFYIAPALTWKPSADTTLTLLSHFSSRDGGEPTVDLPAIGTLYPSPYGKINPSLFEGEPGFNEFKRTEAAVGYAFEHRFGDIVTVRQNARYLHANVGQETIGIVDLQPDLATADRYAYGARANADTFNVDTQAEFKFDTGSLQHTALIGVDDIHSVDRWAERDADVVPTLNLYDPVYGAGIILPPVDYSVQHTLDQTGAYLQDQIHLGQLVFTLGGRKDWTSTEEFNRISDQVDQKNDADRFTYRAGLVYLFDDGFAPYASYSTSFQPGLGDTYNNAALKPVTAQSAEVGLKYQPAGQSSFAMLSAYNLRQQNVVEPDFAHPEGDFVTQTGEIRVRGVELSSVTDLGAGLNVTASYTYMDGTIVASDQGYAGHRAENVPHHMANVWLDKTLQQGVLRGLGFGGGVRYIGSQYGDEANTLALPSTTLLDAVVHYDLTSWRFSVNAQNLLDRVYVNCQDATYCSYGLRRSLLARATYRW
jgi:iron complex outermembrane recepter protein